MTQGKYQEAKKLFEEFCDELESNSWLKNGIWLAGFIYTKSIQAMTLNNIGVCDLESGNIDKARTAFESAVKVDTKYPIPYFNLSLISELSGDRNLSIQLLNKSIELGYAQTSIDKVINKAQEIYANTEGGTNAEA
jgi:tetratricopeptide (TPR) repeat protein